MSRKVLVVSVLAVLVLLATPALAIDGQPTSPDQSLSYIFQKSANFTPSSKVVLVVANDNDYNIIALGDLVARHEGAPLLITPRGILLPQTVELLQQLMENAGVTNVIVVGVGSSASTVADLVSRITVPGVNLSVTRIIAPDAYNLSIRVAIFEFQSSSSAVVTDGTVPEDLAKGLMIALTDNIPVIYEQVPFDTMNATLKMLGVTTVYTTPAVEATTEQELSNAGYVVNTSWKGEDLSKNLDILLADTQSAKNATIVVGSLGDFFRCASVMGVNASILETNSTDTLGTNQTTYLKNVKPELTIVIGDSSRVGDQVVIDIASATGKKVERLFFTDNYMEVNRLGLLEDAYIYPVIVVDKIVRYDNEYKYLFRNIGFSDAVRYGDYAVRIEYTKSGGSFKNCIPQPIFQNDTKVIFYYTKDVVPYDTFVVRFTVEPGTNFTLYPKITYNAYTLAGAVISIQSYLDYLIQKITQFKQWIVDMFQKFFGTIEAYVPLPGVAQTIVAAIIVFVMFWSVIGTVAYVVKVYVLKKSVTTPALYGPVGWLLSRR